MRPSRIGWVGGRPSGAEPVVAEAARAGRRGGSGGDGHGRSMVSPGARTGHQDCPQGRRPFPVTTGHRASDRVDALHGSAAFFAGLTISRPARVWASPQVRGHACRLGEAYLRTARGCPTGNITRMLMVLGASHHDLELTQLDRLTGDPDLLSRAVGELAARPDSPIAGTVVVATCNRLEIYLDAVRFHDAIDEVTATVAEVTGAPVDEVSRPAQGPGRRPGRRAPVHRRLRPGFHGGRRGRDRRPDRPGVPRGAAGRHRVTGHQPAVPVRRPHRQAGQPPTPGSAPPAGRSRRWRWTSSAGSGRSRRFAGPGDRHRCLRPGGRRRTAHPRLRRSVGLLAQRPGRRFLRPASGDADRRRRTGRRGDRRRSRRHLQRPGIGRARRTAAGDRRRRTRQAVAGHRSRAALGSFPRPPERFPESG